jgi:hypothetical protein
MNPTAIELVGTALFGLALIHTFSTKIFDNSPRQILCTQVFTSSSVKSR